MGAKASTANGEAPNARERTFSTSSGSEMGGTSGFNILRGLGTSDRARSFSSSDGREMSAGAEQTFDLSESLETDSSSTEEHLDSPLAASQPRFYTAHSHIFSWNESATIVILGGTRFKVEIAADGRNSLPPAQVSFTVDVWALRPNRAETPQTWLLTSRKLWTEFDSDYTTPSKSSDLSSERELRLGFHRMQLEGCSKRKRRSSGSNGDVENSPVCEAKRPREEDRSSSQGDVDHLATDERFPLTELPLGQAVDDDSDESDMEWLEASEEELALLGDGEDDGASMKTAESVSGEKTQVDENGEPPQKKARTIDYYFEQNSPTPRSEAIERNLSQSRRNFQSINDLINFFKRKGRTGVENRTDNIFLGNPGLQPKMRSVLLEWLVEVCDVYKLHRETYHLTVDYLDRYLCQSENISKGQLQLIGVTALLVASKYEEIYPPKISDFAYITDGACTDQDIIKMENLMVQVLDWRCTAITCNTWVLGYLQLLCVHERRDYENVDVTVPLYNHFIYETVMHLLDSCSLDYGFVKFSYKVLALSSVHVVIHDPDPVLLTVSGYAYSDLTECIDWMQSFWATLCEKFNYETVDSDALKNNGSSGRASDLSHMKIKHSIDLDMLEAAQMIIEAKEKNDMVPDLLLTPPASSEKRKGSHIKGIEVASADGTLVL